MGGYTTLRQAACMLLLLVWCHGRHLQQQQQTPADPLSNVAPATPVSGTSVNGTVYRIDAEVRLIGQRFMPLTYADQMVLVEAFASVIVPAVGPVQPTSYREAWPDVAAPPEIRESSPSVDFAFSIFYTTNPFEIGQPGSVTAFQSVVLEKYAMWGGQAMASFGPGASGPVLLHGVYTSTSLPSSYTLHPVMVLVTKIRTTMQDGAGTLSARQASVVAKSVEAAVVPSFGTVVEVTNHTMQAGNGAPVVELEVTVFYCRENATVASPECEQQVLEAVLEPMMQSQAVLEEWQRAGIKSAEVLSIQQRQPPPAPATSVPASLDPWVPWHLDRLDQHNQPLDGKCTATATGKGVHIYLLSSGVLGTHQEFGYLNGTAGSRVQPYWALLGMNPLEDCQDASSWYGVGTYAASLCCGLQLGAAKDATIHSVRYRERCLADPQSWTSGQLPSGLDAVLTTYQTPAVVLIDTWFSDIRLSEGDPEMIKEQITARLDLLAADNITVIAGAVSQSTCDNVIASHPGVISVGPSGKFDEAAGHIGEWNTSCVDVWAPSGWLGVGLVGASPVGPSNYTRIISRSVGAAAVAAGVAAQYLELHPQASAAEVRRALVDRMATKGVITGITSSPAALLFTKMMAFSGSSQEATTDPSSGSSGLSTGAIVAISICAVVVAILAVALFSWRARTRGRMLGVQAANGFRKAPLEMHDTSEWEIPPRAIEICKNPDGSDVRLGAGRYGTVLKALKDGVQMVAVKKLRSMADEHKLLFIQEVETMKRVSRDANITQFFGVCQQAETMLLVQEYMEGGDLRHALSGPDAASLQWYQHGKNVMLDVVRGIVFLHASGFLHRDVASKNVLLTKANGRAKLADVGLAAHLHSLERQGRESGGQGFVGTLAWASPEAVMGERCTVKSDVYSLGVVLWELVTLEPPQRGCLRLPEVPAECPQSVADALSACLARDPSMRPTAKELYQLLLNAPPLGERQPSIAQASSSEIDSMLSGNTDQLLERTPSSKSRSTSRPSSRRQDVSGCTVDFSKIEWTDQELGSGAFGAVFKVLLDGVQPLACKVVELGHNPVVRDAFLREAELLWRLRHPNVVALTGVAISEGKGCLLMEFMDGGSLFERLEMRRQGSRQRMFGWYEKGAAVALDVARGLHYLHSMRTTHFDIKSGNVLLNRRFTAKIADVGLARIQVATHHSLSEKGGRGTFDYMAPELMDGVHCTSAVDVFSFGVLLWEICTGMHPYRRQLRDIAVPEEAPQAVAELFEQCIAADPAARPTAKQLVEKLSELCAPRPGANQAPRVRTRSEEQPRPAVAQATLTREESKSTPAPAPASQPLFSPFGGALPEGE